MINFSDYFKNKAKHIAYKTTGWTSWQCSPEDLEKDTGITGIAGQWIMPYGKSKRQIGNIACVLMTPYRIPNPQLTTPTTNLIQDYRNFLQNQIPI